MNLQCNISEKVDTQTRSPIVRIVPQPNALCRYYVRDLNSAKLRRKDLAILGVIRKCQHLISDLQFPIYLPLDERHLLF